MKKEAGSGLLDRQHAHWEQTFLSNPELFGGEPSRPATEVAALLRKSGASSLLELGAGQGRDTLFLARNGFTVRALDYSSEGIRAIMAKAGQQGVAHAVEAIRHDVRSPLPFQDASQDACYAHMLFCMALTTQELLALAGEVRRVLKPGGICVYSVRHTGDAHFGLGMHRGEAMYEHNGFIVHFFDRKKVAALSGGFAITGITAFEEGPLPRKLFLVVMQKV